MFLRIRSALAGEACKSATVDPADSPPTGSLSVQQQQLIADVLYSKDVSVRCARCPNGSMTMIDSLVSFPVSSEPGAVILGGQNIPAAIAACTNCGWLDFHALGALGLLDDPRLSPGGGDHG